MIKKLHSKVKARLSEKRFRHTLGVVNMADFLASKCLPDMRCELLYAAYLHDITKELSDIEQDTLLEKCPFALTEDELLSKPIHHSYTAPLVIRRDFPEYATENVLSAVLKHTVADADMSVFDEIIFVADFIEENRTYKSCAKMREYVLSSLGDDIDENVMHLHNATLKIIDFTLDFIEKNGLRKIKKTLLAKEALERKIKQK